MTQCRRAAGQLHERHSSIILADIPVEAALLDNRAQRPAQRGQANMRRVTSALPSGRPWRTGLLASGTLAYESYTRHQCSFLGLGRGRW